MNTSAPTLAQGAVLQSSQFDSEGQHEVRGLVVVLLCSWNRRTNMCNKRRFSFEGDVSLDALCSSLLRTGFQATNVALAIDQINKMVCVMLMLCVLVDQHLYMILQLAWKKTMMMPKDDLSGEEVPVERKCTIFLAFTFNMISSGLRETFLFLVKHKLVDAVVTTAGGIEEDFIKCLAPMYLGDFKLKGSELRAKGINRLGNLLIPNRNYCLFEDWLSPILHKMTDEQVQ